MNKIDCFLEKVIAYSNRHYSVKENIISALIGVIIGLALGIAKIIYS